MRGKSLLRGLVFALVAFAGGMAGSLVFQPRQPAAGTIESAQPGSLVGTFGVGGVVTREGRLWQYRPDKSRWVSLDESFALEGQATSIIPLPIPVQKIRFLETFGFLVATDDVCWLYNIDQHRWEEIGTPPAQ
jgi:hypothetical protein